MSTTDQTEPDRDIVCTPIGALTASIATKRALNKVADWLEDALPRLP